jgi:ADP-dependent phosphofructokinase/glucokinase
MAHLDSNGQLVSDLSDEKLREIAKNVADTLEDLKKKKDLREFKGTPMKLEFAKVEIDRYFKLGVTKNDIACLVASWGLTTEDLEKANNYLHDVSLKNKISDKPQEGIIL